MNRPTLENHETTLQCGNCKKQFTANIHTTRCPHCLYESKDGEIYKIVHDTYNNAFMKTSRNLDSAGSTLKTAGSAMYNCGCALMMIFALLIFFGLLVL